MFYYYRHEITVIMFMVIKLYGRYWGTFEAWGTVRHFVCSSIHIPTNSSGFQLDCAECSIIFMTKPGGGDLWVAGHKSWISQPWNSRGTVSTKLRPKKNFFKCIWIVRTHTRVNKYRLSFTHISVVDICLTINQYKIIKTILI